MLPVSKLLLQQILLAVEVTFIAANRTPDDEVNLATPSCQDIIGIELIRLPDDEVNLTTPGCQDIIGINRQVSSHLNALVTHFMRTYWSIHSSDRCTSCYS